MSRDVAKRFRVRIDGAALTVDWPWGKLDAAIGTFAGLLCAGFGVGLAGTWWPSAVALLGLPLVLVGVYVPVACWANRATLYVTPERIALRHGPVPLPGMAMDFPRSQVRDVQLFESKSTNAKGGTSTSYNLVVIDPRGERAFLLSDDRADVEFLVQTVRAHLRR